MFPHNNFPVMILPCGCRGCRGRQPWPERFNDASGTDESQIQSAFLHGYLQHPWVRRYSLPQGELQIATRMDTGMSRARAAAAAAVIWGPGAGSVLDNDTPPTAALIVVAAAINCSVCV